MGYRHKKKMGKRKPVLDQFMDLDLGSVVGLFWAGCHIYRISFVREVLKRERWHIAGRGSCVSHVWKSLEVEDSLRFWLFLHEEIG